MQQIIAATQEKTYRITLKRPHRRPHADEISAEMITTLYGRHIYQGVESAPYDFVDDGKTRNGEPANMRLEKYGELYWGVGGGDFDEHNPVTGERQPNESSLTKVAKKLGVQDRSELRYLLPYIYRTDAEPVQTRHCLPTLIKVLYNRTDEATDEASQLKENQDHQQIIAWAQRAVWCHIRCRQIEDSEDPRGYRNSLRRAPNLDFAVADYICRHYVEYGGDSDLKLTGAVQRYLESGGEQNPKAAISWLRKNVRGLEYTRDTDDERVSRAWIPPRMKNRPRLGDYLSLWLARAVLDFKNCDAREMENRDGADFERLFQYIISGPQKSDVEGAEYFELPRLLADVYIAEGCSYEQAFAWSDFAIGGLIYDQTLFVQCYSEFKNNQRFLDIPAGYTATGAPKRPIRLAWIQTNNLLMSKFFRSMVAQEANIDADVLVKQEPEIGGINGKAQIFVNTIARPIVMDDAVRLLRVFELAAQKKLANADPDEWRAKLASEGVLEDGCWYYFRNMILNGTPTHRGVKRSLLPLEKKAMAVASALNPDHFPEKFASDFCTRGLCAGRYCALYPAGLDRCRERKLVQLSAS